jgi:hypothetical protein
MIDELLSYLSDEIAMDGEDGEFKARGRSIERRVVQPG